MSRNKVVFLSIALVLMLALSSLAPVVAQGEDALLVWADEQRVQVIQELGEEFEAEFGIPVEVTQIGAGDARDQLLVAGPVGEGPDILVIAHDHIGQLVANGAIVPMDLTGFEEDFTPAALNLLTYQGEIWALPYAYENIALIRNTDLVPEAPTTWEEVREISEEIAESGEAQYGFLLQTGDAYHNYPVVSAFGGYIFGVNDDGSFNISDIGFASEGAIEAAEWLEGMYADGRMVPDIDSPLALELFEQGELAMFLTGPWFSNELLEADVPVALSPVPGGVPFSGGQGFAISAFSDNQLLAETFLLDFVATDETMQAIFDADGRIPAWVNVDTSSNPLIAEFQDAGTQAVPMPAIPEMNSVWSAAGDALTLIANGGDGEEAFVTAADQIIANIETAASGAINSVTLVGSLQDEAGCDGDWDPGCETTYMTDEGDGIWTITVTLPAGDYEYKVAMNADWAENYGADGELDGANIPLSISEETEITFTYDHNTNMISTSLDG